MYQFPQSFWFTYVSFLIFLRGIVVLFIKRNILIFNYSKLITLIILISPLLILLIKPTYTNIQSQETINFNIKKISCFCTDGKISVRINLPLFSTVVPASVFMFLSCRPFVAITTLSELSTGQARRQKWLQHPQDLLIKLL